MNENKYSQKMKQLLGRTSAKNSARGRKLNVASSRTANREVARKRVNRNAGIEGGARRMSAQRGIKNIAPEMAENECSAVPLSAQKNSTNKRRAAKTALSAGVATGSMLKFKQWGVVLTIGAAFSTLFVKLRRLNRRTTAYIAAGMAVLVLAPIIMALAMPANSASANGASSAKYALGAAQNEGEEPEVAPSGAPLAANLTLSTLEIESDEEVVVPFGAEPSAPANNTDENVTPEDLVTAGVVNAVDDSDDDPGILTAAELEADKSVDIYSAEPGMTSPVVTTLQERLMFLGYMSEDEPSEFYGQAMEEAVRLFQRKHNLPITGICDEVTFAAILSEDAQKYSVSEGVEGDDVTLLQQRLVELYYLDEGADTGVYDATTTAAVKKFQQRNGLSPDGTIGEETREVLLSEGAKAYALSYGEESDEILSLQQRLKALGYLPTEPDGKYGSDTVAAVTRFQQRHSEHGLIADGQLGHITKQVLLSEEAQENSVSVGDSGADVSRIQERLVELGYMGSSTGYFGEGTETALKDFQTRNGLSADGVFGLTTSEKLFSNSAIKAPTPEPPKTTTDNAKQASGGTTGNNKGGTSGGNNKGGGTSGGTSGGGGTTANVSGANASSLVSVARSKIGSRYVLGAKGPNQFDCSGFVYWCLNQVGVKQGYMTSSGWRSASYQKVNKSDIRAGDIIVFSGHVGIASSNSTMVDASSSKSSIVERTFYGSYWDSRYICAYRIF